LSTLHKLYFWLLAVIIDTSDGVQVTKNESMLESTYKSKECNDKDGDDTMLH